MKTTPASNRLRSAGGLSALFISSLLGAQAGCLPQVKVPPLGADSPPKVKIGYVKKALSNQGPNDFFAATNPGPLNLPTADANSDYLVTASATDPSGPIKTITLAIGQGGRAYQTITNSQTLDASGTALSTLGIIGTDGHGGVGGQGITATAGNNPSIEATVTATNFNGQSTSMTVIFNVAPGAPRVNDFSVTPNDHDPTIGYINAGSSATLSWSASCGAGVSGCNVAIRGGDGANYAHPVLNLPALGFTGSFKVTPAQNTQYTLQVTNAGQGGLSASKSLTVSLYTPPSTSGLQPYYFKMSCNSQVTPCFTIMVYAQSESQGKQLAEQQNGGCTAQAISAQDFVGGC